jgi:hypothetical protein
MATIRQIEATRRSLQEATNSRSVEGRPDRGFNARKIQRRQIGFVPPFFATADCSLRLSAPANWLRSATFRHCGLFAPTASAGKLASFRYFSLPPIARSGAGRCRPFRVAPPRRHRYQRGGPAPWNAWTDGTLPTVSWTVPCAHCLRLEKLHSSPSRTLAPLGQAVDDAGLYERVLVPRQA